MTPWGIALIVLAVIAVLLIVCWCVGNHFVNFTFASKRPDDSSYDDCDTPQKTIDEMRYRGLAPEDVAIIKANRAQMIERACVWHESRPPVKVQTMSFDGHFHLAGFITQAAHPTNRWVILVHGYSGDHTEMDFYALQYAVHGFNVFEPDLRAQGVSEGDFIGMGLPDSRDTIEWIDYLAEHYGADIAVVLHGHSMGGATVLLASGEELPAQVKAVVSDCSYTSAWDIFATTAKRWMKLPSHPLLDIVNVVFRLRGGYDLKSVCVVDAVRRSRTPTLFIHGSNDDFVPCSMERPLFEACGAQEKEMRVMEGAGHIQSIQRDPIAYERFIFDFLANRAGLTV